MKTRGPQRYGYTYDELADVTGLARTTLVRRGWPAGLVELVRLVAARWLRRSRALPAVQLISRWQAGQPGTPPILCTDPKVELANWLERWPLVDVYGCMAPVCRGVVLGCQGLCIECCGRHGAWRFGDEGHLEMRMDSGWEPYHAVIFENVMGKHMHHMDGNRWNNLRRNLDPRPTGSKGSE